VETKVKICGITNLADAQTAVEAGADAIGFIFYEKSPRFISIEKAAEISKHLPLLLMRVGVFVNAPKEFVSRAISESGLTVLQFHGNERPEFCAQFDLTTMKAFPMRNEESLKTISEYQTDAYLLDAYMENKPGGTGKTFNWDLAVEAQKFGKPIFLSGGLTSENVADAIKKVQPFAVDVSSGVEKSPGEKDVEKVKAFVTAVRKA
jgi:phosphoribosylanthranilate isomerase